jgi:hypothetical protein
VSELHSVTSGVTPTCPVRERLCAREARCSPGRAIERAGRCAAASPRAMQASPVKSPLRQDRLRDERGGRETWNGISFAGGERAFGGVLAGLARADVGAVLRDDRERGRTNMHRSGMHRLEDTTAGNRWLSHNFQHKGLNDGRFDRKNSARAVVVVVEAALRRGSLAPLYGIFANMLYRCY